MHRHLCLFFTILVPPRIAAGMLAMVVNTRRLFHQRHKRCHWPKVHELPLESHLPAIQTFGTAHFRLCNISFCFPLVIQASGIAYLINAIVHCFLVLQSIFLHLFIFISAPYFNVCQDIVMRGICAQPYTRFQML